MFLERSNESILRSVSSLSKTILIGIDQWKVCRVKAVLPHQNTFFHQNMVHGHGACTCRVYSEECEILSSKRVLWYYKSQKKSSYCSIYIGRINQSLYCQKSIENTWSAASIDETAHQVNIKAQTTVVLNMAFSLCGQIESSLFYSVHLHWYGGLH